MSRRPRFHLNTPRCVSDIISHVERGLHIRYTVQQRNAAVRIIDEAIANLPERFPDPWLVDAYQRQCNYLKRLKSIL